MPMKRERVRVDDRNDNRQPNDFWLVFMTQLEKGLSIDENALEEGILAQPELFYKVSQRLSLQISLRDEAKHNLEVTEAEVDKTIRLYYRQKEEKVTEKEIDSKKTTHKDVTEATKKLFEESRRVGELQALKEAFNQRSYALKGLIDLYIAGYYGNLENAANSSSARNLASREAREAMSAERRQRGV